MHHLGRTALISFLVAVVALTISPSSYAEAIIYPLQDPNCWIIPQLTGNPELESFWRKTMNDPVAAFTAALTLFTAVLAVVSIIQIRFLQKADETAGKSADAALIAAHAATLSTQAAIGVELPRLEIRNVVTGSNLVTTADVKQIMQSAVLLTNHGRSNARMFSDWVQIHIGDTLPSSPTYANEFSRKAELGTVVAAEGIYTIKCFDRTSITDAEAKAVFQKKAKLWLFGYVTYGDFLGDQWRSKFCLLLSSSSLSAAFVESTRYSAYIGRERLRPFNEDEKRMRR